MRSIPLQENMQGPLSEREEELQLMAEALFPLESAGIQSRERFTSSLCADQSLFQGALSYTPNSGVGAFMEL